MEKLLDVVLFGARRSQGWGVRARTVLGQLPLNLTMLLVWALAAAADPAVVADPRFLAGQALALGLLGACAAVPWDRLPAGAPLLVPLLDFVPIAILRSAGAPALSELGGLAVFPVLWLAGSGWRPRLAVPAAGAASALMAWAPAIGAPLAPLALASGVMLPAVLLALAVVVSAAARRALAQQQRVEELLERTQARERLLDAILDTVEVGVMVLDGQGQPMFMNAKQRQIYTAALPEDGSTALASLLIYPADGSEEPLPAHRRALDRALAGHTVEHELQRVGRGPAARTVSVSARPFHSPGGERAGAVLAATDVTEAIEALQARDRFVATMSHEFRTPLTNILGYTELLQDEPSLSTGARSDLQVVARNARHLNQMVGDILAAAHGGTGTPAPRHRLDLAQLAREAAQSSRAEAQGRGIALHVTAPTALPVLGERTALVRTLDNLLSNALKYSEPGTEVSVSATADGPWAVCTVTDQGQGIAPEDLGRIFTRFHRTSAALQTGIPGTGLGLALAKEAAEQHGGDLHCTSQPGTGSTFTLRLPLDHHPDRAAPPLTPPDGTGHARTGTAGNR